MAKSPPKPPPPADLPELPDGILHVASDGMCVMCRRGKGFLYTTPYSSHIRICGDCAQGLASIIHGIDDVAKHHLAHQESLAE